MTDRLSDEELVRLDELAGDATPGRVVTLWETRSSRLPEREVRHE